VGVAATRRRFSDWADVPKLTAKKTEAAAIRNSAFIRGVFNVIGLIVIRESVESLPIQLFVVRSSWFLLILGKTGTTN
jgi:hypothetical protein